VKVIYFVRKVKNAKNILREYWYNSNKNKDMNIEIVQSLYGLNRVLTSILNR